MNFENLPANWPTVPLTDDAHIADVLDLFVSIQDRMAGSLLLLICDEQRRPLQPVVLTEIDADLFESDPAPLAQIADGVAEIRPGATALCAIARQGPTQVTKTDRRIARILERAFADRLELLGVHLITLDGTVPIDSKRASAA